jgi:hypothetical protein
MDIKQFDKTTEDLHAAIKDLAETARSDIPRARTVLTAVSPPPDMPSQESAAELGLRNLTKRITALMKIHDSLYKSIGMSPPYQTVFDLQRLTLEGRDELRRILTECVDNSDPQ